MKDRQELIKKITSARELLVAGKRTLYAQNFYEFSRDVVGWPDIYEPLHRKVCNFVEDNIRKKYLLIMLPRGTFKSSIITIGYTLYRIAKNPNERILIANATYPMACQFLSQIKDNLKR